MSVAPHIQAHFTSNDERYSIPDSPFSIPVTVSRVELNELVNEIASYVGGDGEVRGQEFDFVLAGDLLRGSVEDHVRQRQLPTEQVVDVLCIPRSAPPTLRLEVEHKDWVSAVNCSRQHILTGSYDNSIRIWTRQGDLVGTSNHHTAPVKAVRWLSHGGSSGELFVSASQDQMVGMCRLTRGEEEGEEKNNSVSPAVAGSIVLLHRCKGHTKSVEDLDVCPDKSKFCSVSWDGFLKIWSAVPDSMQAENVESESDLPPSKKMRTGMESYRATTRTPLATFQGHKSTVTSVVWAGSSGSGVWSDDDIITGGWDNSIRIWDVATGINKNTLNCPKAFHSLDLGRHNGLLASGNADRHVRLWDARQSETSMIMSMLSSHTGWVVSINWSPNHSHQLLSGSYDSTLRLWDIRSNKKPLYSIVAHEGKVLCSDWTLPEMFASGGSDNKLRTYSVGSSNSR